MGIAAALGNSVTNIVIAIAITHVPIYGRLIRGEMLRISRAAAIAEEQKFASRSQAIANQKGGLDNLATAVGGDF